LHLLFGLIGIDISLKSSQTTNKVDVIVDEALDCTWRHPSHIAERMIDLYLKVVERVLNEKKLYTDQGERHLKAKIASKLLVLWLLLV